MKIQQIAELLNAKVLCGEDRLDGTVKSACGCDMMSDVLAFVKDQAVLLTGLCNPQVVRTAEMMDMLDKPIHYPIYYTIYSSKCLYFFYILFIFVQIRQNLLCLIPSITNMGLY